MEELEVSAKTVDEAVARALQQLGLDRSQVAVEVISEGRPGILGIGAADARVLVRATPPSQYASPTAVQDPAAVAARAVEVLDTLLDLLDMRAGVTARLPSTPDDGLASAVLDVRGDDLGILIGRRGETLASLEYIVNLIVGRELKAKARVRVDVADYHRRREEHLQGLAERMAERVKASGRPVTLEPMPPAERRIVHLALADDSGVVTNSFGEGEHRKVIIAPRR